MANAHKPNPHVDQNPPINQSDSIADAIAAVLIVTAFVAAAVFYMAAA